MRLQPHAPLSTRMLGQSGGEECQWLVVSAAILESVEWPFHHYRSVGNPQPHPSE